MTEQGKYVRIPAKLIEDTELDEKRVLLYAAIYFTKWNLSKGIRQLVSFCGFTPDSGADRINAKIRELALRMKESGYFNDDYSEISPSCFGIIHYHEYKKVLEYKKESGSRCCHWRALTLLAHVRRMISPKIGCSVEYYSNLNQVISQKTGIESRYIKENEDLLSKFELIYSEPLQRYTDEFFNWHTNVRLFVDCHHPEDQPYDYHEAFIIAKAHLVNTIYNKKGIAKMEKPTVIDTRTSYGGANTAMKNTPIQNNADASQISNGNVQALESTSSKLSIPKTPQHQKQDVAQIDGAWLDNTLSKQTNGAQVTTSSTDCTDDLEAYFQSLAQFDLVSSSRPAHGYRPPESDFSDGLPF